MDFIKENGMYIGLVIVGLLSFGLFMGATGTTGSTQTGLLTGGGIFALMMFAIAYYLYVNPVSTPSPIPSPSPNFMAMLTGQNSLALIAGIVVIAIIVGLFYRQATPLVTPSTVPSGPGAPPPPPSNWNQLLMYSGSFLALFGILYILTIVSSKLDRPGVFMPSSLFRMLYYFLPYGLVTYTVISDILNAEYKYSGAIVTASAGFIINRFMSFYIGTKGIDKTLIPLKDSNYCGIPGLGRFGSNLFPQGMLFNLTTLAYLATYITAETERDSKYTIPVWTFLIALFAASSAVANGNGCFDKEQNGYGYLIVEYFRSKGWDVTAGIALQNLATLAASIAIGSLGAGVQLAISGKENFAGHIDPKDVKKASDKKDENIVNVSTALSEVCPAIAEDQIVAEIYQNGKKLGSSLN